MSKHGLYLDNYTPKDLGHSNLFFFSFSDIDSCYEIEDPREGWHIICGAQKPLEGGRNWDPHHWHWSPWCKLSAWTTRNWLWLRHKSVIYNCPCVPGLPSGYMTAWKSTVRQSLILLLEAFLFILWEFVKNKNIYLLSCQTPHFHG